MNLLYNAYLGYYIVCFYYAPQCTNIVDLSHHVNGMINFPISQTGLVCYTFFVQLVRMEIFHSSYERPVSTPVATSSAVLRSPVTNAGDGRQETPPTPEVVGALRTVVDEGACERARSAGCFRDVTPWAATSPAFKYSGQLSSKTARSWPRDITRFA